MVREVESGEDGFPRIGDRGELKTATEGYDALRGMRAEHADVVLRTAFEVDLLG